MISYTDSKAMIAAKTILLLQFYFCAVWASDGRIWPYGKMTVMIQYCIKYHDTIRPQDALQYLTTICCYLHCIHTQVQSTVRY